MPDTDDRYLFEIEGLSSALRVARFSGHEAVSELFHFDVTVVSEDPAIAFADVIGKPAQLTMLSSEQRFVHGLVVRFEQGDAGKKNTAYHVTVAPKPWRLLHRYDCRIFQEKSTPDIVTAVLEGAGLASGTDFRRNLRGTYPPREYCVQWRESDWAFICRLLEDEGIYYWFEHAEGKHTLVLADATGAHEPIAGASTIVFRPPLGDLVKDEHVARFAVSEEVRTGKVDVRDYDFTRPAIALTGSKEGSLETDLPIYEWMNADVAHDAAGRAEVRLEARRALRHVGRGESRVDRLTAGFKFTLSEHPREAFNAEYILARVEHEGFEPTVSEGGGASDARYENRFTCVPSSVPLRPALTTPRPTIRGLQTAKVVGPGGEEIYTDEHGRIKVQFQWDRLGKNDDKSSCWMRVAQTWSGPTWGGLYIPRIGMEVLVDFLDGDPDRPLVVGTVYHGTNKTPYTLPDEKTKSTLKSNSSPGGGGYNEFRYEDKKGSEEVYLRAQKDHFVEVLHDEKRTVGNDDLVDVTHDRTVHVGNDLKSTIDHDETREVKNNRTVKIDGDEKLDVLKTETVNVTDDTTVSLGKNFALTIAKNSTSEVSGDFALTISGKSDTAVTGDESVKVDGSATRKIGSDQSDDVGLNKTIKVGEKLTIEVGQAKVIVEKSGKITITGLELAVTADSKIELKANAAVSIESSGTLEVKSSGVAKIQASGPVAVKGAAVTVN
jgi:type VI secretion system secreted protein VgrG